MIDAGWTAEVTRFCTDGDRWQTQFPLNSLFHLLARSQRDGISATTNTLSEEVGSSLRAAGWMQIGESGGENWNRT